jgi:ABC-type transporter Mla subunit MlaD
MQKQAPTLGRLLTMVVFALSCFGLLLFLWLAFGGPIPLKPQGYRFEVAVPEANQLAIEADVRSSGVNIGKIRGKRKAPAGNKTIVAIELDRRFAPIDADARVIQRSKTLLGERFLEISRGEPGGPKLPEGGRLPDAAVEETTELDEVLDILDPPTRRLFRTWQQELGEASRDRAVDLNDALGNLPRFAASGTDVLTVLDQQEGRSGGW